MLNHIVMVEFDKNINETDRRIASYRVKSELEKLQGRIGGLISIRVETLLLPSSNVDFCVVSKFENEKALTAFFESPLYIPANNYLHSISSDLHITDFFD